ncbi:hypothetical protein PVAND_002833 [Polypedilum vanderplanki]|uniref:RRM domain-containing protein n=1 Tax=Polypedilum vanderplanki TaxID=319348 RepID=A0A9J6BS85_POLVA|nr:hypothetical protein PVAND_002833 [Polypedilum vanderplanki]
MSIDELKLQSEKLWVGNLDLRPNVGEPKGFAFVKFKDAEDTINALTNLNNKRILGKNIAVRYAKHIEYDDDSKGSKKFNIPSLNSGSQTKIIDKKSKIELIEEQLRRYQNAADDFELNKDKSSEGGSKQTPAEPLIKKYQYNKDAPSTSSRYTNYYKKKRKPY